MSNTDDRPLVILDLDNTCICAVEKEELDMVPRPDQFEFQDLEDIYRIYQRPLLQPWLDDLFKKYKVGVWTAAGLSYGLFVIKQFILRNPNRELEFFMWDDHCSYSSRRSRGQAKHIALLEPLYSLNQTVILDDNKDVLKQKQDSIDSHYFDVKHPKAHEDIFLKEMCSNQIRDHFDNKLPHSKMILRDEINKLLQ